jgi:hypothetical protein
MPMVRSTAENIPNNAEPLVLVDRSIFELLDATIDFHVTALISNGFNRSSRYARLAHFAVSGKTTLCHFDPPGNSLDQSGML